MGEGSDRMKGEDRPKPRVGDVTGEIDAIRDDLGALVAELDRRRIEAFDVGLQIRKHPTTVAIAAVGAALVVGGLVAWSVRKRRQRKTLDRRAKELRRVFGALTKDPYNVARDSSLTEKLVATAGTTVVTLLAKRLFDQWLPPASAQAPRPPRTGFRPRAVQG